MDEALLVLRGKVDEWRFFRHGFNLLHRSAVSKPANILDEVPLPFDDEIRQSEQVNVNDMIEGYNKLIETGWLPEYLKKMEVARA